MAKSFPAVLGLVLVFSLSSSASAEDSLEDLVQTKIFSVSKKEEDPRRSASANFVLTDRDLEQMGVRHVADALQAVPGFQVSKITSNKWMVASRGFGEQFSNKLLVLVDGRPIYTTIFSGVLWYQEDIPIQDIKQIEVIRGSGATVWGSNAVNGVINILTKSTSDTLGQAAQVTAGINEKGGVETVAELRHGQNLENLGTARSSLKLRRNPSNISVRDTPGYDDSWQAGNLNIRFDSKKDPEKSFKLTGSVFKTDAEQTYTFPTLAAPFSEKVQGVEQSSGGHLLGEWNRELDQFSSYTIRSYIDYTEWEYADYQTRYANFSVEGQYNHQTENDWEFVTGAGYRITYDEADNSSRSFLNPSSLDAHFGDVFLQAKAPISKEQKIFATAGSKVESNTYDNLAFSPSFKVSWEPDPLYMAWVSWSRANRIPSRNTQGLTNYVRGTPGGYVALIPSKDYRSEELESYEIGGKLNPLEGLQLDIALFYNRYDRLRTFEAGSAVGAPVAVPLVISNSGEADNKGFEISSTYQTSPNFRINLAYSYHDLNFELPQGAVDNVFLNSEDKWAKHAWIGRTSYLISDGVMFNTTAFYYSEQDAINLDPYAKVNTNITWQALSNTEIVFGIDNLTKSQQREYSGPLFGEDSKVPRLYYTTLRMQF